MYDVGQTPVIKQSKVHTDISFRELISIFFRSILFGNDAVVSDYSIDNFQAHHSYIELVYVLFSDI